jgi:hypothetical protein
MKLFAVFVASIHAAGLECYAEQDKFDLGHSDLSIRPQCDPNNSRLFAEVQCNSSTCTCTDTVTGQPSVPARSANLIAKAMLKCSGTKCLAQSKTAAQLAEQGLMDASGPECDVMGNYKLVQCSFAFCSCQDRTGNFAEWAGANNIDNQIPMDKMDYPVKYCLGLLTGNGWTLNGPKE